MAEGVGGRSDLRQGGSETGCGGTLTTRWIREVVRDGGGTRKNGALGQGDLVGQPTAHKNRGLNVTSPD